MRESLPGDRMSGRRGFLILAVLGMMILQIINFNAKAEDYQSISNQVKMKERWLKVTIYYLRGSEDWARHILDISIKALPIIEKNAGFPFPCNCDVKFYEPRPNDKMGWGGAAFRDAEGIWIPKDRDDGTFFHELAHYWSFKVYKRQWMNEGFAEFLRYITYHDLNRNSEAEFFKNGMIFSFLNDYEKYEKFLYKDWFPNTIPTNWTDENERERSWGYIKSFSFFYILYVEYGLDTLLQTNSTLYSKRKIADNEDFKRVMANAVGKNVDDFFSGWIFEGPYKVYSKKDLNDTDSDGLIDIDEKLHRTNPKNKDTDGDKLPDGIEIQLETDPLKMDTDNDGSEDGKEVGMIIDGKLDDWKAFNIDPIIRDPQKTNREGDPRTDIIEVYAVMDRIYLYVAFLTLEKPDPNAGYVFAIDVNNDNDWDYSFGFRATNVWFYDVRNYPNSQWPERAVNLPDEIKCFDSIAEIRVNLSHIGGAKKIVITPWIVKYDPIRGVEGTNPGKVMFMDTIISTDPLNPDTDGDGLKDGVDPHPTIKESLVQTTTPPPTMTTQAPSLTPSPTPSSTPIQEKKKTSIPILSIFLAILLVNYWRKVRK